MPKNRRNLRVIKFSMKADTQENIELLLFVSQLNNVQIQ